MHIPLLLIVPPGEAQTLPLCPWDKENILQAQSQPKGIRITWQTLPQLGNATACVPTTAYPVWHMPCGFPNTEFRVGTLFRRFQWRCWQRLKKKPGEGAEWGNDGGGVGTTCCVTTKHLLRNWWGRTCGFHISSVSLQFFKGRRRTIKTLANHKVSRFVFTVRR